LDIYWWHSRSLGYIGIYWSRNAFEGVKIMPSSQPENQLDNDKDLRQEILYEFLNQFKEDKYLSQGNTDKAVGAIDQYTQSKLKAFAEEFEKAIGEDEKEFTKRSRPYEDSDTDKLWDLANGIEPISSGQISTWGSSATTQFRKFALKLRNTIWKEAELHNNELRAEIREALKAIKEKYQL